MQFKIKKTKTGRGVFAGEPIKKGVLITPMSGKERAWEEVEQLIGVGKVRVDDPFQVAEDYFVLLDRVPRLFNHHCEPNAGIKKGRELVALRTINSGEEITYDYSAVVCTHSTWTMRCKCGSVVCRKKIGNVKSLSPALRQTYKAAGLLPRFIAKELSVLEVAIV